jgi:hypothetical protein
MPKSTKKTKIVHITSVMDSVGKYLVLALDSDGHLWQLSGLYEGSPHWKHFPVPTFPSDPPPL